VLMPTRRHEPATRELALLIVELLTLMLIVELLMLMLIDVLLMLQLVTVTVCVRSTIHTASLMILL